MINNIFTRKKVSNYKQKLEEQRQANRELLGTVSSSLSAKLERYYESLNGEHSYFNSESGKIVQARTYKKRLDFANIELEGIEREVQLSRRYGKINEKTVLELKNYTNRLYNIAIKNNQYVKKTKGNRTRSAKKVRLRLHSIKDKFESKSPLRMNVETNYQDLDERILRYETTKFTEEVNKIYTNAFKLPERTTLPVLSKTTTLEIVPKRIAYSQEPDKRMKYRRVEYMRGTNRMSNIIMGTLAIGLSAVLGVVMYLNPTHLEERENKTIIDQPLSVTNHYFVREK